ncbi:hypothetical protein HDU98_011833 [Podochytrium sp. JEL0797]|nr:hypothetical protein HDU98_011833 [Podochytrium sp. JEL0797]
MVRLAQNVFFAHFATTKDFALLKSSYARGSRDWILLVPQQASLVDASVSISAPGFAAAHVLVPLEADPGETLGADLGRGLEVRSYRSLGMGGRRVEVAGTRVRVLDANSVVQEVFVVDDVLFAEGGVSFTVLCISEPLNVSLAGSPSTRKLPEPHDSILSVGRILGSIKNARTGISVLDEINAQTDSFNDRVLEMENLETVKSEMEKTLDACINIIEKLDATLLKGILGDLDITHDVLLQLTETFVMENTYEFTFFLISRSMRQQDADFSAAAGQIASLDLSQLGLSNRYGESLMRAVNEFSQISTLRTPFEKIKCLMNSIRMLNGAPTRRNSSPSRSSAAAILSSDVLVPLLVLIAIRSDVQNLPSSLYYMQNFSFEHDVVGGEFGYALSSLEAVVSYILVSAPNLSSTCSKIKQLWMAINESDLPMVECFFDTPESPQSADATENEPLNRTLDIRTKEGDTLLILACRTSSLEIVEYLIKKGVNVNSQNYDLETPLHIASLRGDLSIVQLLLAHQCKSTADHIGYTPFLRATECGHVPLLHLLPSSPTSQTKSGITPFHLCPTHETLTALINLIGTNTINARDNKGLTPVLLHCQQGNAPLVVSFLHLPQVTYQTRDHAGRTILHLAAFRGYVNVIEAVATRLQNDSTTTDAKQFLNALSIRGNAALHAAAEPGNLSSIQSLILHAGARAGVKTLEGKMAGDLARDHPSTRDFLDSCVFLDRVKKDLGCGDGEEVKFAMVCRLLNVDGVASFWVKSVRVVELEKVVSVQRTLSEFEFLKQQLLLEFPDTFLPSLTDIIALDSPASSYTPKLVRQLVNRLNDFLRYLLNHPLFSTHPLVWVFLTAPHLDPDEIMQETDIRITIIFDAIDTYPPAIASLDDTNATITKLNTTHLVPLATSLNQTCQAARKLWKSEQDVCSGMLAVRFGLGRPAAGSIFGATEGSRFVLVDAMARWESIHLKYNVASTIKLAESLYDSMQTVTCASKSLSRLATLSTDYLKSSREATQLSLAVSRLETSAQANPTEDIVTNLSEVYYKFSEATRRTQQKASLYNYSNACLKSELEHFEKYHAAEMMELVNGYAESHLRAERECLDVLLELIPQSLLE